MSYTDGASMPQTALIKEPKIIYVCYLPLIEKREKDFFIKESQDAGFSVEYWDLTKIYFPDIDFVEEIKRDYVRKIHTYLEFETLISKQDIKQSFFVLIITFNGQVIKLHRILTKHKCFLVFFARTGLPVNVINETLLSKLYRNLVKLNIKKVRHVYLNQLAKTYLKFGLIKNYDLVFVSGSVDASRYNRNSRVVALNHFDYDNYLIGKNKTTRLINYEYCVFLDDNIVYDTDYKIANIKAIDSAAYFASINRFFSQLEKRHGIKVVIAAHPKAHYQGNEFGNREIIKNYTNELVKDCRFAIAHYSTSISFAVLYQKAIVFIYTNVMKKMFYFKVIKHLADVLNASCWNIDTIHSVEGLQISYPDHLRYDDYKYKYLISKATQNTLSASVFIEQMIELSHSIQFKQT